MPAERKKLEKANCSESYEEQNPINGEKHSVDKRTRGSQKRHVGWTVRPHKRTQDVGHVGIRIIYESYMQVK